MSDDERDELIGELRGLALTAESHHCHLALHSAADLIDQLEAELARFVPTDISKRWQEVAYAFDDLGGAKATRDLGLVCDDETGWTFRT